jgi:hypothetical protein
MEQELELSAVIGFQGKPADLSQTTSLRLIPSKNL